MPAFVALGEGFEAKRMFVCRILSTSTACVNFPLNLLVARLFLSVNILEVMALCKFADQLMLYSVRRDYCGDPYTRSSMGSFNCNYEKFNLC